MRSPAAAADGGTRARDCDVIVVGGGSAGCVIASRLSEDPACQVLLIEAGPDPLDVLHASDLSDFEFSSKWSEIGQFGWGYRASLTSADDESTTPIMRGRLLGGSGAVNGSLFVRPIPDDFDAWPAEWSFDAVLPAFRRSETDLDFGQTPIHGGEGPIRVRRSRPEEWDPDQATLFRAATELGLPENADLNDPGAGGVGAIPRNDPDGVRFDCATTYLRAALGRPNLHILTGWTVRELLLDRDRVRGVLAISEGGEGRRCSAPTVVVAAGAIGSPHLLMVSGIGPRKILGDAGVDVKVSLPGVGGRMQDHPQFVVRAEATDGVPSDTAHGLQVGLLVSGAEYRNDVLISAVNSSGHASKYGASPTGWFAVRCGLERPNSIGRLSITSSDITVPPALWMNYFGDERDLHRASELVPLATELIRSSAYARLVGSLIDPPPARDDLPGLRSWLLRNMSTSYHTVGTCAMADDDGGVVDAHGRVRDVEGLYVMDLSIAPAVVRAPTNATAVMIGERGAELIRADLTGVAAGSSAAAA